MVWNVFFVIIFDIWLVKSMEGYYQPPRGSSVWGYFNPPLVQRVPNQSHQSPLEAMVELTNNLGVSILQDNSFSRGNFAFSPYGVASVLVVLYEGTRGESARQIHRAIGFPADKDVIRIGFRDIHRNLRSYFSHEGYLSGISLNKESSSLKPGYKKILRFYGYDVDLSHPLDEDDDFGIVDNSPSIKGNKTTVTTNTTPSTTTSIKSSTASSTVKGKNTTVPTTVMQKTSTKPTVPSSTEDSKKTTTEAIVENTEKPAPSTTENDLDEKTDKLNETETTSTTATPLTETTTVEVDQTENDASNATTEINIKNTDEMNPNKEGSENVEEEKITTTENYSTLFTTVTDNNSLEEHTEKESEAQSTNTPVEDITNSNLDNGMLIPQPEDLEKTTENNHAVIEPHTANYTSPTTLETTTAVNEKTVTEDYTKTTIETTTGGIEDTSTMQTTPVNDKKKKKPRGTKEENLKKIRSMIDTKVSLWLGEMRKKPNSKIKRTITDYLKTPQRFDISLQLQNGMYDTYVSRNAELYRSLPRMLFLVDGAVDTPVPMMTHTNVFPYAYIPRLHSKALEFPLDDVRYKLLILLPIERRGLRQLTYDLTDYPLNRILESMRPARVRAIVPTFMVEGFVILTSSLQKLGIWDVFDPRKANLSGMSMDPELYVRNIEQSVTVVIRNYVEILDIQTRK